jgi:hypothetical protein
MPKVYNKRDPNCPADAIYVGRPTKWGNPFSIGRHGSREYVVDAFRHWFMVNNSLRVHIHELRGKDLICWCAPKSCHADVLLELANS